MRIWHERRRAVLLAAIATVVGGLVAGVTTDGAHAGDGPYPDGIVVVGDSITARYSDDEGAADQGWWSFVGRHFDADVRTFAQSGSGYQRQGNRCTGDVFADRIEAFEDPPSVFIVEGGRNDWSTCRDGRRVRATDAAVQDAVVSYLRLARQQLPESTRIVVLGPPWGELHPWEMRRITSIIRTAAGREGLEYVSTTGTLDQHGRTDDGVHPTRAGSKALGDVVVAALSQPAP
ncbi:SGNH/GDSL hydrolase family protein [Aeromicrobium sp. CTD01-1L150]|uniref:SGNH/GDSL hydrolase family protein n=1 Tax=Aeromicrobium sp. CTD01-1L150 TaxID=3341830 RepID=UPI0035C06433